MEGRRDRLFENNPETYYRFSKRELLEQKKDLLLYIVINLTKPNMTSINETIKQVKELTGATITAEKIMQLRRHSEPEQTQEKPKTL